MPFLTHQLVPPCSLMTNQHQYQGNYQGDDGEPTSSVAAAPVFNLGFDANPYLAFLLDNNEQLQAEANARALYQGPLEA